MAINRYRFYLGPRGLLQPLPPLPAGASVEAPLRRPAADHVSLSGRTTRDYLGRVRRSWPLAWSWLTEDEELRIQAAIRGLAQGGIRLMDPRKRNLATEDISTGGGTTWSTASFTASAGTLAFSTGGVPLDFLGITNGRLVWTGATAAAELYGIGEQTPTVGGGGSTYTVSMYVKSTTSFQLAARPYDLLGAEMTNVLDPTVNPSTAGNWDRFSWVYTPDSGACGIEFGIVAGGSGNIETTGWLYQIDQTLGKWTFGYGCPQVQVSADVSAGYWRTKYQNVGFVLTEV